MKFQKMVDCALFSKTKSLIKKKTTVISLKHWNKIVGHLFSFFLESKWKDNYIKSWFTKAYQSVSRSTFKRSDFYLLFTHKKFHNFIIKKIFMNIVNYLKLF